jgi:hypothetical protein
MAFSPSHGVLTNLNIFRMTSSFGPMGATAMSYKSSSAAMDLRTDLTHSNEQMRMTPHFWGIISLAITVQPHHASFRCRAMEIGKVVSTFGFVAVQLNGVSSLGNTKNIERLET